MPLMNTSFYMFANWSRVSGFKTLNSGCRQGWFSKPKCTKMLGANSSQESLSKRKDSSLFSTNWWKLNTALYLKSTRQIHTATSTQKDYARKRCTAGCARKLVLTWRKYTQNGTNMQEHDVFTNYRFARPWKLLKICLCELWLRLLFALLLPVSTSTWRVITVWYCMIPEGSFRRGTAASACMSNSAHPQNISSRSCQRYGSTTVSDTLGDGITEKVSMIRSLGTLRRCSKVHWTSLNNLTPFAPNKDAPESGVYVICEFKTSVSKTTASPSLLNRCCCSGTGYSSRTLEINKVPMPAPVPPPKEWHNWNPPSCRLSWVVYRWGWEKKWRDLKQTSNDVSKKIQFGVGKYL